MCRETKLHATFLNTKHRKIKIDSGGESEAAHQKRGYRSKRIAIDGRELLSKYGDFFLGYCAISTLHLSEMQEKDANGYYSCAKCIEF